MACYQLISLILAVTLSVTFAFVFERVDRPAAVQIQNETPNVNLFENFADNSNSTPRCGEVLTSTSGGFFYKPFESVLPNERCVFIIGVPQATSYTINILYLGAPTNQNESGQQLVVTGVRNGLYSYGEPGAPVLTSYSPNNTGHFEITNSNFVIVTFFSSSETDPNSQGVALEYEAKFDGTIYRTANESSYHLIEAPRTGLKYPPTGNYTDFELSAFVFLPGNNIFDGTSAHVLYQVDNLERDTCFDSVFIYTLDVSSRNGIFKSVGRICGNQKTLHVPNDDIVFAIFQADKSGSYSGFYLSYISC